MCLYEWRVSPGPTRVGTFSTNYTKLDSFIIQSPDGEVAGRVLVDGGHVVEEIVHLNPETRT